MDGTLLRADLEGLIAQDPARFLIEMERELVAEHGLAMFIRLGWHAIEGSEDSYLSNWHIDAICDHLQAVSRGEIRRLAIAVPPRHMKPVWQDEWVVLQDRGRVRLKEVVVGDLILTHKGRYRRVEAVHDNGILPTMMLETVSGRRARMAPDHPVLTKKGWTPINKIECEEFSLDEVCVVPPPAPRGGSDERDAAIETAGGREQLRFALRLIDGAERQSDGSWLVKNITDTVRSAAERAGVALPDDPSSFDRWHVAPFGILNDLMPGTGLPRALFMMLPGLLVYALNVIIAGQGAGYPFSGPYLRATTYEEASHLQHLFLRTGVNVEIDDQPGGWNPDYWHTGRGQPWRVKIRGSGDRPNSKADNVSSKRPNSKADNVSSKYAFWDGVHAIYPMLPARCICLTVAEDASFTAGDIAVHNSISVAVMYPAWDWLDTPWRRFLFASYAHNLSIRDSTKCRRVIQSPWYQARWGDRYHLTSDQNTKIRFDNSRNGYRLATSVDGQLTGEGGDIIVIDDPLNALEAVSDASRTNMLTWWKEAMSTRLNDPKTGAYILIQQRLHENDLVGHVLKHSGQEYTYLCLPAEYDPKHPNVWIRDPRTAAGDLLWPERVGRVELEALKIDLGDYAAAGQLQQLPAPREGGLFKRGWFEIVDFSPGDCVWARGWDFAATEKSLVKVDPDWTATVRIGWSASRERWYIADVGRWREEPHEVEKILVQVSTLDPPHTMIRIPQDPAAAGKQWAQRMLVLLANFSVSAEPVSGDKVQRTGAWRGKAGGGMVKLVKGDWNETFLVELTSFPTGNHDDMVDAASSAFEILTNNTFGIMEFYRRQASKEDANAAEALRLKQAAVAAGAIAFPGAGAMVRMPTIEEYARALMGADKEPT